ncbi:GNAT family N-acetyltransferase [Lentzea californiensis]|uniref:GNAT family N-acetyltransferase n=1 Tax=Lentzea californiensis TaxID=438851 RepID=UPI002165CA4A|nr:GNAT family N-acetyltransferase [Lentzea californiensis]MCR3751997.1 hypothetical protein [Lentzea californiensis]
MIDSTEALESVEQLTAGWRAMVLDQNPDADVRDLPGVAVRWADCKFPFWNCVTFTEPGIGADLLAQRFAEAADVMRTKQEFGFLWVFEDLVEDADLDALADRAGLAYAFPGTGMAGDLLPIPGPSHPELTFERVTTDEQLQVYADINSRAYGFGLEAGRDGIGGSALWKSGVHAYLGLRDGVPVTCAGAVETAGRLFVVLVATERGSERRGYGEAVTRKALYEAWRATGITRATLHATVAGAPVYPRIGFEPNSPIRFYALKG